tara:strand:- start:5979 stop:7427 length:1449 start_codon:yes stop_codon:yes gene_type:complete
MVDVNNKNMTHEERELEILRAAVDKAEKISGRRKIESGKINDIIQIVETFIIKNKLVVYGGTAINNILPKDKQFYDYEFEIPDYDAFSPSALKHAKGLADVFYKAGYENVEAKSGMHKGTFKIFVNHIAVADITDVESVIFKSISREAINKKNMLYAPANYLRMSMYNELSSPQGDVSRWEKVLKRLTLLNKVFPIVNERCDTIQFQRDFEGTQHQKQEAYTLLRDALIEQNVVFFGGWASSLYGRYMSDKKRKQVQVEIPDFDVLSEDPYATAKIVASKLRQVGLKHVRTRKKSGVGDILSEHYEIMVDGDSVCFVYKPLKCHSYNTLKINNKYARIATIDTMLSLYLIFCYCNRPYYDVDRLLCMSKYLFEVQRKNKFSQKGILKRFSVNCYGNQQTIEELRAEKGEKYNELKKKKNSKEFQTMFLKYVPASNYEPCRLNVAKPTRKSVRKKKNKTRKSKIIDLQKKRNPLCPIVPALCK